jgi:uncharacterized protein (TIGR00725 family)
MNATFRLSRRRAALYDAKGRYFSAADRRWLPEAAPTDTASFEPVDVLAACTWLQRESGHPLRVPIAVIGPREASDAQRAAALAVGEGLGRCGLYVICGGRHGVMQSVCEGVARGGGISIGLLPDPDPALANAFVTVAIATGIGEARNALIARAAFCLVAIGDSFGTLSEVALGRQFGKRVIALEGAAEVSGIERVDTAAAAVLRVAEAVLALG